jgi:RNA polymerase sigma-70 factor (ECF subfamily)
MLNNCYQKQQKFSFKNEKTFENAIPENSMPMYSNNKNTDTDNVVINRELNHILEHSLTKIPVEYRMVFSLREINGMNVSETAEAMSISESNVKVRLNRAKSMLRKEIEKTYNAEEIFEFNLIYCDAMVNRVMSEISRMNELQSQIVTNKPLLKLNLKI